MKVALDTNLLAYAEGLNDRGKQQRVIQLLHAMAQQEIVIPVQTLGELFNVLVRKARMPAADAQAAILAWSDHFPVVETSSRIMLEATDLSVAHQLSIWDAVILSAASDAGCRILLSEDMQHGFTWHGTTVVNPFLDEEHPLLSAARC
ncbi:MAG: PIN domain-containing protein [Lautropia sp.]|nr:PIN domain-containing protein [Lautropia sp.]